MSLRSSSKFQLSMAILLGAALSGCSSSPSQNSGASSSALEGQALKDSIQRGQYIATVSNCISCHTGNAAEPFGGGTNFGLVESANITPDPTYGIGKFSFQDFRNALQSGVRPDGTRLLHLMPSELYAAMKEQDLQDLYSYFMHGVKPVAKPVAPDSEATKAARAEVAKTSPIPIQKYTPNQTQSAQWNRGQYLIRIAHCSDCHSPRNPDGLVPVDETQPNYLAGSDMRGWYAPKLRNNPAEGLGRWSEDDIIELLKTARNSHSSVVGPSMNMAIYNSTQHITPSDLKAMAVYLKTLAPTATDAATYVESDKTAKQLFNGDDSTSGAKLYLDNCAGCHRSDGAGYARVFPKLAGNSAVMSEKPTMLISLILEGSRLPQLKAAPSDLAMPGFAWRLNDQQVADLVNFVRTSWGNGAPANATASDVAATRKTMTAN